MSKQLTITLSLTEEEVKCIERSLIGTIYELKEDIKGHKENPDSEYFAKYAAEAERNIPVIEDLIHRIIVMRLDQKYPLLGGQET